MQQKSVSLQTQEIEQEPIGMQNLPELPVSAKELEELLAQLGAEVSHPVRLDPVAHVNGKFVGFWTE